MIRTRVIPCLLLRGRGLVKTVRFKDPRYLGDPRNIVKIFNEKQVDELVILDILATPEEREPHYDLLHEIASEAFMPVAYGGGVRSLDAVRRVLKLGIEKVIINSAVFENPNLISEISRFVGSQSTVVSIDVRRTFFGKYEVVSACGNRRTKEDPVVHARNMERLGAGEILVNSIDRDGMMTGYDLELIRSVTSSVTIPVIACGGAGSVSDFTEACKAGASAVAAGSMFVFQGKHRAVLISFPPRDLLETELP